MRHTVVHAHACERTSKDNRNGSRTFSNTEATNRLEYSKCEPMRWSFRVTPNIALDLYTHFACVQYVEAGVYSTPCHRLTVSTESV